MGITFVYWFLFVYNIFVLYHFYSAKNFRNSLFAFCWSIFSISFLRWDIISAFGLIISFACLVSSLFLLIKLFKKQSCFFKGLFALSIGVLIFRVLFSLNYTRTGLDISPVFRDGAYVVIHGGSFPLLNHHYISNQQKFAADIIQINFPYMSSRKKLIADKIEDFYAFRTKVYSPCDGVVTEVINNFPNEAIDFSNRKVPGNRIVIRCQDNIIVKLVHLNPGSIPHLNDDIVATGDFLGEIGNSGNSTEPHLHIQANDLYDGPIELTYNNFKLTRNFIFFSN